MEMSHILPDILYILHGFTSPFLDIRMAQGPLFHRRLKRSWLPTRPRFVRRGVQMGHFTMGMARKPSKTFGSFQPSDGLPLKSRSVMVYEVGI